MATFTEDSMLSTDHLKSDQQTSSLMKTETIQTTGTNQTQTNQTSQKKKWLKVEIYEVDDGEDLDRLDALEGHPRWYVRTPVKTKSGDVVEVYNMPLEQNTGISSEEYLALQLESEDENNLYYNWNR